MTRLSYPAKMPEDLKELAQKYAYTYILKELLRVRHNKEGAKYRTAELIEAEERLKNGEITRHEFNTVVEPILAPFRQWQVEWFTPRQDLVTDDLLELRGQIMEQAASQGYIDLGTI